jgi:hypothetical protein
MATLDTIQAAFERYEREQKVRDAGLLRSFQILCDAIDRNGQVLEMIHKQCIAQRQMLQDHIDGLSETVRAAVEDALDDRFEVDPPSGLADEDVGITG